MLRHGCDLLRDPGILRVGDCSSLAHADRQWSLLLGSAWQIRVTELPERHFFQPLHPFCISCLGLSCSPKCETKSSCLLSLSGQKLPQAGIAGEGVSFSCHNTLKNPSRSSEAPSLVPGTAFQTTSPLLYNLDQNALDHPRACVCWDQAGAQECKSGGRKVVRRGHSRINRLWGTTSPFPNAEPQCGWCSTAKIPLQCANRCPDSLSSFSLHFPSKALR